MASSTDVVVDRAQGQDGQPQPTTQPQSLPPLNVIALISGGKDSLFSILHCLSHGHKIVALANLHPPLPSTTSSSPQDEQEQQDLDSYMYQTVGHSTIPLYATVLQIPLYRQEILGSAVNTSRDYSTQGQTSDETESLVPLLEKVLAAHPEANAISTGAILSTYQRTRVESVALRLGLTPLSYLWQYPFLPPYSQSQLLRDMAAVGQDARIIKVASGGLDDGFLWQNVADSRTITRLQKAMARFGENGDGAVLGEGGEFETLAIDGPSVLWKKRIEIEDGGLVSGEGGNAIFRGKNQRVVEKEEGPAPGLDDLRIPDLWDEEFKKVLDSLSPLSTTDPSISTPSTTNPRAQTLPTNITHSTPSTLAISNLASPTSPSPSAQLQSILQTLTTTLSSHSLTPSQISHTTLLLRSISLFASLNIIYTSIFPDPNPPSRVTISCGENMPEGVDVMLSAIVPKHPQRNGLHVQSRSYWAPANIGPYSQATTTPLVSTSSQDEEETRAEVVYVAGQIPLIPSSMEIYHEHGFRGQAVLALQHLWRIGRVMGVRWWCAGVAYISDCHEAEAVKRVELAQEAWKNIHQQVLYGDGEVEGDEGEEEDVDPWDMKNRGYGAGAQFDDTTYRAPIPNPDAVKGSGGGAVTSPPCFVVQVSELPRNVDIEWHSTGFAKGTVEVLQDGSVRVSDTKAKFVSLEIEGDDNLDEVRRLVGSDEIWEHGIIYTSGGVDEALFGDLKGVQRVPCKKVWGEDGKEVRAVLVGRLSVEQ